MPILRAISLYRAIRTILRKQPFWKVEKYCVENKIRLQQKYRATELLIKLFFDFSLTKLVYQK